MQDFQKDPDAHWCQWVATRRVRGERALNGTFTTDGLSGVCTGIRIEWPDGGYGAAHIQRQRGRTRKKRKGKRSGPGRRKRGTGVSRSCLICVAV